MAIYYIDYENVHNAGLHGVETLTEADCVHIFYKDSDTMQLPVVKCLLESKATVRFERVRRTTLNALDFQLLAELFCSANQECENYIISHDKGYDSAIDVARAHNISLQRKEAIDAPDFLRPQRFPKADAPIEAPAEETVAEELAVEETVSETMEAVSALTDEITAEQRKQDETPAEEAIPTEAIIEEAPAAVPAPAEEAAEPAEVPAPKQELPSRRNSRRSRGNRRRTARAEETAPVAEPEQVEPQIVSVDASAEAVTEDVAAEPAAVAEVPVINPEEDAARIAAVVQKNSITTVGEADYGMIAEAVRNTDNKNRFYQYFVKALGADKGQQFYRGIKSYYLKFVEALK